MNQVFKGGIKSETVGRINKALDDMHEVDSFEILISPINNLAAS